MTVALIPTAARLGSTLVIPDNTEIADEASLALFCQPIANALAYSQQVTDIFHGDLTSPSAHNADYAGSFSADSIFSQSISGRRRLERLEMPDANTTILGANYDLVCWFVDSTPAANRNLIIDTTGMVDGHVIEVSNLLTNRQIHVTGTPGTIAPGYWNVISLATNYTSIRLIYSQTLNALRCASATPF